MGTETWIISLPLSDSILYLKIIHPPNFREEPNFLRYIIKKKFPMVNVPDGDRQAFRREGSGRDENERR